MTTSQQAHTRMLELRSQLEHHSRLYYQEGQPTIPDHEYDKLFQELLALETTYPGLVSSDSPTQRVMQMPQKGFKQVKHKTPMLSLQNCFDEKDITTFVKRCNDADVDPHKEVEFVLEPKVDGLPVELIYREGKFVQAITRGTGAAGDDVTAQVRTIRDIPLKTPGNFPAYPEMRIRGEVYMSKPTFELLNGQAIADGMEPWANPRNAAVGALKSHDPAETAKRRLSFVGYEITMGPPIERQERVRNWLKDAGVPYFRDGCCALGLRSVVSLMSALEYMNEIRGGFPFMTDGAVLKVNDRSLQREMGANSSTVLWATAFKYPPTEAITTLKGVTLQMGKQGVLTPVAELETVLLDGSRISRASLHNYQDIAKKDIKLFDKVVLIKSAEVIPFIKGPVLESRTGNEQVIVEPTTCPFCNSPTEKGQDEDETVAVRCSNWKCPERVKARLTYAISKAALDVEGAGPSVIAAALKPEMDIAHRAGVLAALFEMSQYRWEQVGYSAKQAKKLVEAFAQARHRAAQEQDRVLRALCIPNVGNTASRALLAHFGDLYSCVNTSVESIRSCPDLLPVAAESFLDWRTDSRRRSELDHLPGAGFEFPEQVREVSGDQLVGESWCITGTLSVEREVMQAILRAHGAKVVSGVSGKTTHLLAGDKAGSKIDKATKLGVKVVTENEIRKRLGLAET